MAETALVRYYPKNYIYRRLLGSKGLIVKIPKKGLLIVDSYFQ